LALTDGFKAAVKRGDYEIAIEGATAFGKGFPSEKPLADKDAMGELKVQALSLLLKAPAPDLAYARLTEWAKDMPAKEVLDKFKLSPTSIRKAYVDTLMQRGWYSRAAAVLQELAKDDPSEPERQKYVRQCEDALLKHAEACQQFGSYKATVDAVAQCKSIELSDASKTRRARVTNWLDGEKAAGHAEIKALGFGGPVLGNGTWADPGGGYQGEGKVQIGKGGDAGGKGTVIVQPGFVLDGAEIYVERGTLDIRGTRQKPIIMRNVKFSAELGGEVKAENTIFVNCTFSKGGGWVSFYSSHWTMKYCLLVNSSFASLKPIDYGVKIVGCTFVESSLPPRLPDKTDVSEAVKYYSDEWSQLEGCACLLCDVSPSSVWMSKDCAFTGCTARGRDPYAGTKSMIVHPFVPPPDLMLLTNLQDASDCLFQGEVRVAAAANPPKCPALKELWPLLPAEAQSLKAP
jgi:hypothetical protein